MCAHVDDDEDDDGGGDGDDGGQWKLATVIYGPFAGAFGKKNETPTTRSTTGARPC